MVSKVSGLWPVQRATSKDPDLPDLLVSRSILITLRLFLSARNEICSPLQDRFFVPPIKIKSSSPTNDVVPSSLKLLYVRLDRQVATYDSLESDWAMKRSSTFQLASNSPRIIAMLKRPEIIHINKLIINKSIGVN